MNSAENRYLELWRVSKTFTGPRGPVTVVKDFDVTIRQGEFVSIIGHSGCGKSTVLSIVAGLSDLSTGGIILAGREIDGAGPDRGVVFQSPSLLPWLTAFDNVMLGVAQVKPKSSRAERREIVEHYLSLVGLADAMHKRPAELSQGMRQRVGLARAFALDPKVLLLDEPFGMLDSITRIELQEALMELWAEDQKTALMVTHDVDEALYLSDRVVMMTSGPESHVGDILTVPFPRPRLRPDVLEHPEYFASRERLTTFLEEQDHTQPAEAAITAPIQPADEQLSQEMAETEQRPRGQAALVA
jgi:nitrate/nitrite transport system ATP-binding protein